MKLLEVHTLNGTIKFFGVDAEKVLGSITQSTVLRMDFTETVKLADGKSVFFYRRHIISCMWE